MNYNGLGISSGNEGSSSGGRISHDPKVIDRRVRIIELVLRVVLCGSAILSAALIGSNSQTRVIFTIQKKARFTDMNALVFLVVTNGMIAAYSLVQIAWSVVSMVRASVLFNRPLAWVIFSADQVMAYLTLAALAAAAQSSVIAKLGQPELQWMKLCDLYGKFCNQTSEGIVTALFVSLCSAIISAISAYSLFRLYGGGNKFCKNNNCPRW